MMRKFTGPRRGSILLVTFMAITIAALVATGLLLRADASQDVVSVAVGRTQSRALAWSGIQAAVAQLAAQRDTLLAGGEPQVFETFDVPLGGAMGVITALTPGEDTPAIESESARAPLNALDAASIGKLPGIGPEAAATIFASKGEGFFSPESALADYTQASQEEGLESSSAGDFPRNPVDDSLSSDGATIPVSRFCTVFSFDPEIAGIAAAALWPSVSGEPRLVVSEGWTTELQEAVAGVMSDSEAVLAEKCFKVDRKFSTTAELAGRIAEAGVPQEQWGAWLDLLTTNADRFRGGVVDINRAPVEVLACIPGISEEAAGRMVAMRETLDAAARGSITWPLDADILTREQFLEAVNFFATRSLQYRIRVQAGTIPAEVASAQPLNDEAPKLSGRIVLEAVIDLADEKPRLAYLRDVTLEPWQSTNRKATADPDDDSAASGEQTPTLPQREPKGSTPEDEPSEAMDPEAGLSNGFSMSGLDLDADLELSEMSADNGSLSDPDEENAPTAGRADKIGQESMSPSSRVGPTDNRIGRWTFRRGRR